MITPRITSTIPAITPVKSIVIVQSWAITRYARWGQLHICFAVKFLIVAFTELSVLKIAPKFYLWGLAKSEFILYETLHERHDTLSCNIITLVYPT
jgi:hypothetical protein